MRDVRVLELFSTAKHLLAQAMTGMSTILGNHKRFEASSIQTGAINAHSQVTISER